MIKRNLFIVIFGAAAVSMAGCSVKGKNYATYTNVPAVVDFNETGGKVAGTMYGDLAINNLDNSKGDCILLNQLKIDYDNQPSPNYLTVTEYDKEDISKTVASESPAVALDDYTFPLSTVEGNSSLYYRGKYFLLTAYKGKRDAGMEYRLVYATGETESNGLKNIYLQAKSSSTETNVELTSLRAFDMQNLIDSYGRDSTINVTGGSYTVRYLRANLKYLSKMEGNAPVYKTLSEPLSIAVFK